MPVTQLIRQKVFIRNVVVAAGIFSAGLVLGTLIGQNTIEDLINQLGGLLEPLTPTGNLSLLLLLLLFINNAIKALGVVVLGILLGIPPLLFLGLNGFIIGGVGSMLESASGWRYAVVSLAPHGVVEIAVILLATALGLTIGVESIKWLLRRESRVKPQLSDCLKVYLKWILPGLALAAIIEVFVTPRLIALISGN
jgi:stage II sporulation protein M